MCLQHFHKHVHCIPVYIFMHMRLNIYTCLCTHVFTHVCTHVHPHFGMHVLRHAVYTSTDMSVNMPMYMSKAYLHTCLYTCMLTWLCNLDTHVHIHVHIQSRLAVSRRCKRWSRHPTALSSRLHNPLMSGACHGPRSRLRTTSACSSRHAWRRPRRRIWPSAC